MEAAGRSVPVARFRDQCLRLVDEVRATGESLVVTKHGRPVAVVVPYVEQHATSIVGWSADIRIDWDPETPAIPPESWHGLFDPHGEPTGGASGDEG